MALKRFWTCHWQYRYWRPDINPEGEPIGLSGSNNFRKRGVTARDAVYVISLNGGQLFVGGRVIVEEIVSRKAALKLSGVNLWPAKEWITCSEANGTKLNLHRRLSPEVTKLLRFKSKGREKEPFFVSKNRLDNQATRGIRELTIASAELLDRIIEVTDQQPIPKEMFTVTADMLEGADTASFQLPDEIPPWSRYLEGSVRRICVNRYERDRDARNKCIEEYGYDCYICGFNFGKVYGPAAKDIVHVHHLARLSDIGADHEVDHVADLRPVCPNCHAVIHQHGGCREIEEVVQLLKNANSRSSRKMAEST